MGISIGRFGLSPAGAGLEVDVSKFRQSGDIIDVGGDILPASGDADPINTMRAMRSQLMGYLGDGGDAEFGVPVIWDDDPHYSGVYRVLSATCEPTDVMLASGRVQWSAQLQRVVHGAAPWLENRATLLLVANDHSYTAISNAVDPCTSMPGSVDQYQADNGAVFAAAAAGADGTETRIRLQWSSGADTVRTANFRWRAPLADWYRGACIAEGQWGSTYYPLVGRQATNELSRVRARNGLVRVTPNTSSLQFDWWGTSSWVSSTAVTMHAGGSNTQLNSLRDISILRNSPEAVVLRCAYQPSGGAPEVLNVDVAIRRGSRTVAVTIAPPFNVAVGSFAGQFRLAWSGATPCTQVTSVTAGAIRYTSADGNGNRPVMICPDTNTQDLTNGRMTVVDPIGRFAVGCEIGAGSSVQPDRAIDQAGNYFSAVAIRSTVVGR